MSLMDYNEFIQREFVPEMVDTVVYKKLEPMVQLFGQRPNQDGDRITSKYRLGHSSNAAFYDKSDVNPAPSSQTLAKPYWTKVFSHASTEVHGIDISNASSSNLGLVADALMKETEALMDLNVGGVYAQWLKDVDSSSTAYSDNSLSRSTYPLLVSYEETSDAAITLAYFRAMVTGVTAGKSVNKGDYVCFMEQAVYDKFRPLAAAVNSWTNTVVANTRQDTGYPEIGNFEGIAILDPASIPTMTTGTVFMLRKQDVAIVPHRLLEITEVSSGRDSIEYVLRMGLNSYVDNPYLNGKMLTKD